MVYAMRFEIRILNKNSSAYGVVFSSSCRSLIEERIRFLRFRNKGANYQVYDNLNKCVVGVEKGWN